MFTLKELARKELITQPYKLSCISGTTRTKMGKCDTLFHYEWYYNRNNIKSGHIIYEMPCYWDKHGQKTRAYHLDSIMYYNG